MVRAYRRKSAVKPKIQMSSCSRSEVFDRVIDTQLSLHSLDDLDESLIETLDTFTPLRIRIGDDNYIVYVEEWAYGCLTSEAIDEAEKNCGDDEDCLNGKLEEWVQDEGDRIAEAEGWDGFVYTHIGADYGETTFYKKERL